MRPTGPLAPQVYWTRRLVLMAVVALVTALVWWLVSGSGRADETSADRAGAGSGGSDGNGGDGPKSASGPTTPTSTMGTPTTTSPGPRVQHSSTDQPTSPTRSSTQTRQTRAPLAQPSGDCRPQNVDMKIDVGDSAPGEPNVATLLLTSIDTPACTVSITPEAMTVRVTSGDDVVWSSDDCPDALRAQQVVAREDLPSAYQFRWSGQRSSENCQSVDSIPEPGGYWVEAAMIGGEPHHAYFDIRARKS